MAAASRDTPPTPRLDAESEEDALNWNPDELRLRRALDRQAKVAAGEYVRPRGSIREAIAARRASRGLATERVSIAELAERNRAEQGLRIEELRRCSLQAEADGVNLADAVMLPVEAVVNETGGDSESEGSDAASEAAASETAASDDERVGCTTSSDDFVGSDSEAPAEGELASSSSSVAPDDFEDSEEEAPRRALGPPR